MTLNTNPFKMPPWYKLLWSRFQLWLKHIHYPENVWYGGSITREHALDSVGKGWSKIINNLYDAKPKYTNVVTVKEKFGCYDDQTEILTFEGWKYFRDITKNDKIATLESGSYLKYYNPTEIYEYDYEGKMYALETRGVSLLVTLNHNLYVASPDKLNGRYKPYLRSPQKFELQNYQKFYLKNKKFKKNCIWEGVEEENFIIPGYKYSNFMKIANKNRTYIIKDKILNMDDFLEFLGWYIAEGCTKIDGKDIAIACCNVDGGKEKAIIENCIRKLGYKIKTSMENRSALTFRIYNKQLGDWLLENCGHLAHNKKVPTFVKGLSSRQIRIFLSSLYAGDGRKTKTSHILTTVSKQLANDVQELILKSGDTFRWTIRKEHPIGIIDGRIIQSNYPANNINWLKKGYHNTQEKGLSKKAREELIDYKGKVYCVEVPNHIIYIRRNGKGVWCGNSLRFYCTHEPEWYSDLIEYYEKKSGTVCERCGKPGKLRSENRYWILTLCDDCDRLDREQFVGDSDHEHDDRIL